MNIKARGRLYMEAVCVNTGKVLDRYFGDNLVVDLGKLNVARLLGGDTAGKKLTHISVGTSAAAPAAGDTSITNAYSKAIDSVAYVGNNTVQFNYSIASGEANGITIQEAGLFNDAGALFARKTRNPIVKTSAIALNGIWEIQIS